MGGESDDCEDCSWVLPARLTKEYQSQLPGWICSPPGLINSVLICEVGYIEDDAREPGQFIFASHEGKGERPS